MNAIGFGIRLEGNGRLEVRFIRESGSTSINWLKTAEPPAARIVPRRVCRNVAQLKSPVVRAATR